MSTRLATPPAGSPLSGLRAGRGVLAAAVLAALAGLAAGPSARAQADPAAGEPVYQKYCSQCHGVTGEADGPAAPYVLPRPRVLKDNSTYKFRSTASGELPTDRDLYRVIMEGIPGTSMPRFDQAISKKQAWNVVALIKSWSEDFQDYDLTVTAVPMPELADPEPVEPTAESLERGRIVYEENKCWQCHGQEGRGDGPSWIDMPPDEWGNFILAANLSNPEAFRNGHEPEDVFRTISTGLNGTPMPAYADSMSVEDRWHLVNYVLSLGPENPGETHEVVVALPVEEVPPAFDDEAWSEFPRARFKTGPNIIEPPRNYWPTIEYVMAQAAWTPQELVLRVQWDDRSESEGTDLEGGYEDRDGRIHHRTDHPDQLAVQFPTRVTEDRKRPYILFGDGKRSVTLWWWRSDTGEVQEISGKGWGTFQEQGDDPEVQAELEWEHGRYTLLLRRTLVSTGTAKDVEFVPGEFLPIAFHAWDGARGEVGQRRALTTWQWLYLRPPVPKGRLMAKSAVVGIACLGLLVGITIVVRRKT